MTGRWVFSFSTQTALMSSVFRVAVSKVRIPRSHSTTLGFPSSQIDPRHTYAARAEIRDPSGALRFVTDTRYPVLTQGAGASADIVLKAVGR